MFERGKCHSHLPACSLAVSWNTRGTEVLGTLRKLGHGNENTGTLRCEETQDISWTCESVQVAEEVEYKWLTWLHLCIFLYHGTCINKVINIITKQPRYGLLEPVVVMALRK